MVSTMVFPETQVPLLLEKIGDNYALKVVTEATRAQVSAFGENLVSQLNPKAVLRFDYGAAINPRMATATTANGGGVAVANSMANLTTSAANNGSAKLSSLRRLRYLNGMGGLARFTAVFTTGVADSRQLIGIGDDNDGFFFGYNGAAFSIAHRRAGSTTYVAQANWNGEAITIDPTKGNVYQIRFQWLGFGYIRFYVLDPTDPNLGWRLVHSIMYPNTATVPNILNPTLPLWAEAVNSGNTTDLSLKTASMGAYLEGNDGEFAHPLNLAYTQYATASFADTNDNHLFSVQNQGTWLAVANRIPVNVRSIILTRANTAPTVTFKLYKGATFAIPLVYTDVDANNSPMRYSATTTTYATGTAIYTFVLSQNLPTLMIPFRPGELQLYPGEVLSVVAKDSGAVATESSIAINWDELF